MCTTFMLLAALIGCSAAARLSVSGKDLMYNKEKVFLNGINFAWKNYGHDFGNGDYSGALESWLQDIAVAGGNSIRVFLHAEGYSTPAFDSNGYVTACDNTGDFENDVLKFLNAAQENNILVMFVMWDGRTFNNQLAIDLAFDNSKLDSYINNCMKSMMNKIKGHPALAAIEAVSELERSVKVASSSEACYDTTLIGQHGAGRAVNAIPMERYLHFIGRQNQAVRAIDPNTLITAGASSQCSQSDAFFNTHNHYADACLNLAAGGSNAGLDFYQMHTYASGSSWSPNAPFTVQAVDYLLDKPLMIGECASTCAASGSSLSGLFNYAYQNGYCGVMSFHYMATGACSDSSASQMQTLSMLSGSTFNGKVDIQVF